MKLFKAFVLLCITYIGIMPTHAQSDDKPNFLVIVADDLGWSDLGFLGSQIQTPNLDSLASRGVFMSDFYVAPTCSPTRAMLMTGVSNHAAGVGTMRGLQAANQMDSPQYAAQLHDGVVTVAEALKTEGYQTVMSGKWHLSLDESQSPSQRGFDRSFGLIQGGASHFADQKVITPSEEVDYRENGKPVVLASDFYSTIGYTDKIIEYIDEAENKPFFAYLTYTAPHDPLQVPDDWLNRYAGKFDDGPEPARLAVQKRLNTLGLVSEDAAQLPPHNAPTWLPSHRKPWLEREENQRRKDARRMEIYASMIELLDQEIGRVIDHLDGSGKLDNTYIIFMSDNGASIGTPLSYLGQKREWVYEQFDLSYEQMGRQGSYTVMGSDWNHVSNTPFRNFKGTIDDGGVRSPLIVSGPGVPKGAIQKTPAHVMDITPTLLELAGINPETLPLYNDKLQPVGTSILPAWSGEQMNDDRILITELFGSKMVRQGKWKAVFQPKPLGKGAWELFDTIADPGSTEDLAEAHPEMLSEFVQAYEEFAEQNGVIYPHPPFDIKSSTAYEAPCNWWCQTRFGFVDTMVSPKRRQRAFAIILGVLALSIFGLVRRRRRKKRA